MTQTRTAHPILRIAIVCLFVGAVASTGRAAQQAAADRGALGQLDADLDAGNQLNWGTAGDGDTWDGVT